MKPVLYLGCPAAERADTERLLAAANLAVLWADNAASAVAELQKSDMPVLLDLSRGAAALQIARDLRAQHPGVLLFAVVDNRRPDLTTEAVLTGVADVFARPPAARRLASAIERETHYESRSHARQADPVGDALYSHSPSMRDVIALISRASAMRAGVMVRGEDGTGRQVVARAIHAAQSDGAAFVCVDCAGFEGDGLEIELFGPAPARTRGAHAQSDAAHGLERISRQSRLHEAIGGTLYLKNVAEASTRVQGRVARLLRDREAILSESGAAIGFDIRPMAGVDPGVDTAVEEGRVREELFRRLSVIRIDMPPLRNRREDIPALANYFLREICRARRVPPKTLSRPALSLIAALPWRGNAVELRTMLDAIVAGLSGGKGLGLDDVLGHVRLDGGSVTFANRGTLRQARSRFEREYIAHILEQHHGRISEAAKALGVQRTNLYRKLRSLRVDRHVGK